MLDAGTAARLTALTDEYRESEARLADPDTLGDPKLLREVSQRYKELEPIVACFAKYQTQVDDIAAAEELMAESDGDDKELFAAEVADGKAALEALYAELREHLIPKDPHAGRAVIMEIRGAEGGEEANLFAKDLFDMYEGYASTRKWKIETLNLDPSDMGGFNQVTFIIRGEDAWQRLKFEGGPHRVQRVPVTESQGRVHTSAATVAVLPEVDEVDIEIDQNDLQIDTYRASGAGGQHVNTTDSAIRITHMPTGVIVTMQDERSQLQNKNRAMQVLRARLYELAEQERNDELSAERRSQVGGGGRGEKIRTYNYKENRVTDHRIGCTVYRLTDVLAGDMDHVITPLLDDERTRQLSQLDD